MQFVDSLLEVKRNYPKYDAWEQAQNDDAAKRKYLAQKLDLPQDKIELTREKAKAVFRATDLLDKHSEDNCANRELANNYLLQAVAVPVGMAIGFVPLVYMMVKKKPMPVKQQVIFNAAMLPPIMVMSAMYQIWSSGKEKEASRIGRFQAKQHELKDIKNFAIYTPEQIKAAEIIAKKLPDKKDKTGIKEVFSKLKEMSKDKVAYEKWLKDNDVEDKEIEKILKTDFTPEQMQQGEEDKEVIVNIVKDVNMQAENYSENVENVFDAINMISFATDIPLTYGIKKGLTKLKVSAAKASAIAGLACITYPLAMLTWSTMKKKEASKVGRFVKRKEILDNPEAIMAYTKEQMTQAKDVKAPSVKKGIIASTKENFVFLLKFLQNEDAYQNYMKTANKENEKFYDALKETELTDKQLADAKNLQTQTFRAFDKIDEKSQRYSEDMEAATEIGKNTVNQIFSLIGIAVPVIIGFAAKKGKLPLRSMSNAISKLAFKPDSQMSTLAGKMSSAIKNDKALKDDFSKFIFNKEARSRVYSHKELNTLYKEFAAANKNHIDKISEAIKNNDLKGCDEAIKKLLESSTRKNIFSKISSNAISDLIKLNSVRKMKTNPFKDLGFFASVKKVFSEFKTITNIATWGIILPFTVVISGIPYAITSWMTNVQLKAGKIGIMQAINEIDNPKLYVNSETK